MIRIQSKVQVVFFVAGLAVSSAAFAQSVLVGDFGSNWNPRNNPRDAGAVVNDNAAISSARFTNGGDSSAIVMRHVGQAIQDGNAFVDSFGAVSYTSRQTFQLNANADISMPSFMNGAITFTNNLGPPNNNFGTGSANGRVLLEREDPANAGVFTAVFDSNTLAAAQRLAYSQTAQANGAGGNANLFRFYTVDNLAATAGGGGTFNYRLIVNFTIAGNAGLASANNSQTLVDFGTAAGSGLLASFADRPAGFNSDSRTQVGAPLTRTTFGVDGTGVAIGILEPGRVNASHAGLNGRVEQRGGTGADFFSDHTTAVASIAAGNTGTNAQRGVAPGASLISYASDTVAPPAQDVTALNDLVARGARVINMSAFSLPVDLTEGAINGVINANPRVTFVKSAGNASGTNTAPNDPAAGANNVTLPGLSPNIITVGALNRDFSRRADFSSFNNGLAGSVAKPDIMAPGEYITSAATADLNGDGMINDFDNRFTGNDQLNRATTGAIAGTSFAAPHVSGAVALMMNYADTHQGGGDNATHDVTADDHRAIKAVLLNSARRDNLFHKDGATRWGQNDLPKPANGVLDVTRSMDRELGSGALDVFNAMRTYAAPEARLADAAEAKNVHIEPRFGTGLSANRTWDLQAIQRATRNGAGGTDINTAGTVDYVLGEVAQGSDFRACLTWDSVGGTLPHLEMQLWAEGAQDGNQRGFVPNGNFENQDIMIASTMGTDENVKLFDFKMPFNPGSPFGFYLLIINLDAGSDVDYGLAFSVPAPSAVGIFAVLGIFATRRRRA